MKMHFVAGRELLMACGLCLAVPLAGFCQGSFSDFLKSEREQQKKFQEQQKKSPQSPKTTPPASNAAKGVINMAIDPAAGQDWAANKPKADAALALYEQTQAQLARLREMVNDKNRRLAELYKYTTATWSYEQHQEYAAVQRFEGDINAQRDRVKALTTQWDRDYDYLSSWTEFGRKYQVKVYNPSDPPGKYTILEYDLVKYRIARLWPTGSKDPPPDRIEAVVPAPQPAAYPPLIVTPVPPSPEPPEAQPPQEPTESNETTSGPTGGATKAWDQMTVKERHEALKNNDPGAWDKVREALLGGDPESVKGATEALGHQTSGAQPPGTSPGGKTWQQMTTPERHAALKKNDPAAWQGLRDALLSGEPGDLIAVLQALSGKSATPPISKELVAIAYWQGYQLGLREQATKPEQSELEMTANAYQAPELMAAVRKGFADAMAGKPAEHQLPVAIPGAPVPKL